MSFEPTPAVPKLDIGGIGGGPGYAPRNQSAASGAQYIEDSDNEGTSCRRSLASRSAAREESPDAQPSGNAAHARDSASPSVSASQARGEASPAAAPVASQTRSSVSVSASQPRNGSAAAAASTCASGSASAAASAPASEARQSTAVTATVSQARPSYASAAGSQGRPSTAPARPSTTSTAATASQARPSTTAAASQARASASGSGAASLARPSSAAAGSQARVQPSIPRAAAAAPSSVAGGSVARQSVIRGSVAWSATGGLASGGSNAGGAPAALKACTMATTMPSGQFAGYGLDTAKYLKELVRRRDEAVYLRVLPRTQLLQQLAQQEAAARELSLQQEGSGRLTIVHKALEDRAKKAELAAAKAGKEGLEAMKRTHAEEVAAQKASVAALHAETEREVRERLALIQRLQPKLNPTAASLADVRREDSDCVVLAQLLEEDKRLQKALKGDSRYDKSKTADTDGGALPFWLKHCAAASFNVAAILQAQPCRAAVIDAPSLATKVAADKKVLVVRATVDEKSAVIAWAHTRVAAPDAATAAAALLPMLGAVPEEPSTNNADIKVPALPETASAKAVFAGVVWTKDDCAATLRLAKAPKTTCGCLANVTKAALAHGGVASFEMTSADVRAIGEAASQ